MYLNNYCSYDYFSTVSEKKIHIDLIKDALKGIRSKIKYSSIISFFGFSLIINNNNNIIIAVHWCEEDARLLWY